MVRLDRPAGGRENMAADEALLQRVRDSDGCLTALRLYQWQRPTVSIGHHQQARTAFAFDYCRREGIPWVRRPSGGRAVFHDAELTYCVASNDDLLFPTAVAPCARRVGEWLLDGLRATGVHPVLAGRHAPAETSPRNPGAGPCFVSPTRGALLVGARKLVGSAQKRVGKCFLQHGSIPLRIDYARMGQVLDVGEEKLRDAVISVEEAAGRPLDAPTLATTLEAAFLEWVQRAPGRG